MVIPSEHITDKFKIDIEMKDVIYSKESLCGLTGQKFESNYYDGSAASTTVISIPSIETMIMYLKNLGHFNFSIVASPEDFTKIMIEKIEDQNESYNKNSNSNYKKNKKQSIDLNFESKIERENINIIS